MNIDTTKLLAYAYPCLPHAGTGLTSRSNSAYSRFQCGFFVRKIQHVFMSGCVGICKDGRFELPVCQPTQSGTLFDIMVSGLKPINSDITMNTQVTTTITVETLPSLAWNNQPVITTELLANVYETDVSNIKMNFSNNAVRFIEGQHYFKLSGQDLKNFKNQVNNLYSVQIAKNTASLILWTERGTVRHAKMLGTDKAWDVQDKLEQFYFSQQTAQPTPTPAPLPPSTIAFDGNLLLSVSNGQITASESFPAGTFLIRPRDRDSVRKWIMDFIPAQLLPLVIETATNRLLSITRNYQ
jgi:hypothetical protein